MKTLTLWLTCDGHNCHQLWLSTDGLKWYPPGTESGAGLWEQPVDDEYDVENFLVLKGLGLAPLKPGDGPVKCELRIGVE